ncbi:cytochrome P450 87A3-like [Silene latifolia]|uniref:cytochrome P450 87A3-like n=1 Tax=Silene latifolia TaxID=37657 RepID=UPI003D76B06B
MSPFVLSLIAVVVICITHWVYKWYNPKYNGNLPPGTMGWPLIGETLQFFAKNTSFDIPSFVKMRMERYGPVFRTSLVGRPIIISADAELNYLIFQQEGHMFQSWYPDTFTEIFGREKVGSLHGFMYKYLKNMVLKQLNHVQTRRIPESLNRTKIVLIPKVPNPQSLRNFRPISLCNTIYKIITKILVLRLRHIIPSIISPFQSSFLQGRGTDTNFIVASEIIYSMKTRKGKYGWFALKVDLEKAYDCLEWSFIKHCLSNLNFDDHTIQLIMSCISSTSSSVTFNGTQTDWFLPSRGIRQGDPLSPLIFILCMEFLSKLIDDFCSTSDWTPFTIGKGASAMEFSHLLFADDLLLFGRVDHKTLRTLEETFNLFHQASGLSVNKAKSTILFSPNADTNITSLFCTSLDIKASNGLGSFLGFPLTSRRPSRNDLSFIVDKVRSKLSLWKSNFLSRAGIGFFLRDHNGIWACGGWKTINAEDALCAELIAIRTTLLYSLEAGWTDVYLATDCAQANKLISLDSVAPSRIRNLINDCRVLKDHFQLNQWSRPDLVELKDSTASMIFNLTAKKLISYNEENSSENLRDSFVAFIKGLISFPLNIPGTAYHKCLQGRMRAMTMLKNMLHERRLMPSKHKRDFFYFILEDLSKEGTLLTEGIALDLMFVLLFASFETTSLALTLAMKFLTDYPLVLKTLTEEHEEILRRRENKDSPLAWNEYKLMTYTFQFINETVRLANIVPDIFRKAMTDFDYKGYTIPAGWGVMVCPPAIYLNQGRYENPLEFDPSRWQGGEINGASKNFMAFGGGMRFCVGTDFTKVKMAVFLHYLVIKYRWQPIKGGNIVRTPGLQFPQGFHIQLAKKQ